MLFKVTKKVLVSGPIAAKYNYRTGKLVSKEGEFRQVSYETVKEGISWSDAKVIVGHDRTMSIVPMPRS